MPQSSTFGARLAQERKRLGFNQSDFAALCDVSSASQFVYEKDERSPSADYLTRAVGAGVRLGFLFWDIEELGLLPLLTLDQIVTAYIATDISCRDSSGKLLDLEHRVRTFKDKLTGDFYKHDDGMVSNGS